MKKEVTIKDIARELGIHHSTVSRALYGSHLVKEKTRKRIVKKAREMGYVPNLLARGFRNKRTKILAVVVPNLRHHVFASFVSRFSFLAAENGYLVNVFQSNDKQEVEKDIVASLPGQRVAGVALSFAIDAKTSAHLSIFSKNDIPFVQVDRILETGEFPTVSIDNYSVVYDLMAKLRKEGKTKIAYVWLDNELTIFNQRLNAYEQGLVDFGFPYRRIVRVGDFFVRDGYDIAPELLYEGERPEVIMCINDDIAVGLMIRLKEEGFRIPEDIAVIGYDGNPVGAYSSPALTTFSQSADKLAEASFEILRKRIEENIMERVDIVFDAELTCRESFRLNGSPPYTVGDNL